MGWSPGAPAAAGALADIWTPADNGLIAAAFDPACLANTSAPVNGTPNFVALAIRQAVTVSKVWLNIGSAGVTPSAGENFVGLYGPAVAGVAPLLASVNVDGIVTGTGPQSGSITPQLCPAGLYYAGFFFNAATPPTLSRCPGSPAPGNVNLAAAAARFFTNGSGLTTAMAASITLASNVAALNFWAGLS